MGGRRVLFGVETTLLVATLACAAGYEVVQLDSEELLQLLKEEPSTAAGGGADEIIANAKAKLAKLAQEEGEKAIRVANQTAEEGKKALAANEVEAAKVRGSLLEKTKEYDSAKSPPKADNSTASGPPSPRVMKEKQATLTAVKNKVKALEASVQQTEQKVKRADQKVKFEKEQFESAKQTAETKETAMKQSEVMQQAARKAAATSKEFRDKKNAEEQATRNQKDRVTNAEDNLLKDKNELKQQQKEGMDAIKNIKLKLAEKQAMQNQLQQSVKDDKVIQNHARVDEAMAKAKLNIAELQLTNVKETVHGDAAGEKDAEAGEKNGRKMIEDAHFLTEINKERIHDTLKDMDAAYKKLQHEKHQETMDQAQVVAAQKTIDAVNMEIVKMEKKKELVHQFGVELRQKGDTDAEAAQSAMQRAKSHYVVAKRQFDAATVVVNNHQKQIDEDEATRVKSLKSVLAALDDGHIENAITSGEEHERADEVVQAGMAKKENADHEARVYLQHMQSARQEENQAEKLQLMANREYTQAASNDRLLHEQINKLEKLRSEQAARNKNSEAVLANADKKIMAAEQDYAKSRMTYNARVSVSRYLNDVRMRVAQRLMNGAGEDMNKAKNTESDDNAAVMSAGVQAEQAQEAMKHAVKEEAQANERVKENAQDASNAGEEVTQLKKDLVDAEIGVHKDAEEGEIKIERANLRLHDVTHPVKDKENPPAVRQQSRAPTPEQQTAESDMKGSVDRAKSAMEKVEKASKSLGKLSSDLVEAKGNSNHPTQATRKNMETKQNEVSAKVEEHNKASEELDVANAEIDKAKNAYHAAFGSGTKIPGHDETISQSTEASADASKAQKDAKTALQQQTPHSS